MHATGVTAARCVAALAPRCAFSLPLPFRFGVTTHFLTRAMRATEPRVGANAPPATARTSDPRCPTPSSRKRRCAPTARGGYPRVRGGPHLAGACPDASRQQYPRKPRTNCLCRDFPRTSRASSRRVTLRHTARPPSRSIPLTRDFPRIHPTTRPTGLRAPSSVSRRNRARAVAVRATYTGASRARSRSSFRRSRRFFRYGGFGDCHPYARALLISRIFFLKATKEPLFSSLFPFSSEKTIHHINLRRRDGRRSPPARDERHVSADGIHAMSFVSFATTT